MTRKETAAKSGNLTERIQESCKVEIEVLATAKSALEAFRAEADRLQTEADRLQGEIAARMARVAAGDGRAAVDSKTVLALGGAKIQLEALEECRERLEGQDIPMAKRNIEEARKALQDACWRVIYHGGRQLAEDINSRADALVAEADAWKQEAYNRARGLGLDHEIANDFRNRADLRKMFKNEMVSVGWHQAKRHFGH